ncbi:DUF998 domain-containing protein [Arthrobacter sp. UYEF3]|uniref:DUF998 domain-containing protein n=1 Tax=Arthrobacter sp. UYEF3 TaxID=1756365 RepID=UPI003395070F
MTTRTASTNSPTPDSIPATTDARTRFLLACGIAAGPLYLIVGFAQAFTRPGFDPARNDLSVLANGDLGWIQITNLLLTGLLTFLSALGIRRVLRGGKGGIWGPAASGSSHSSRDALCSPAGSSLRGPKDSARIQSPPAFFSFSVAETIRAPVDIADHRGSLPILHSTLKRARSVGRTCIIASAAVASRQPNAR